jgi:hypothetical protein
MSWDTFQMRALARLRLDPLLEGLVQVPQRLLGRDPLLLRALAIGNFLGNHIYARNGAIRAPYRMPAGEPEPLRIGSVRPLPVDLDAGDGLARAQDALDDALDLIGDLRERLAHGASDMIGDRNSADFSQTLVDLKVAAVRRQECKADRGGVVDQTKLGQKAEWPLLHLPRGSS